MAAAVSMPLILAIEQSSAVHEAALLRGTCAVARQSWRAESVRSQRMFAVVPLLCAQAGVSLAEVDLFAVGTGPGSFSGVRASIATARAMALPGGRPVVGVGSAEALAARLSREHFPARRIVVFGDARRQRVWIGEYEVATDGTLQGDPEPRLAPVSELVPLFVPGTVAASPDRVRLQTALDGLGRSAVSAVLPDPAYPDAVTVGVLAAGRFAPGAPPPAPIYLHPPVFVQPSHAVPSVEPGRQELTP